MHRLSSWGKPASILEVRYWVDCWSGRVNASMEALWLYDYHIYELSHVAYGISRPAGSVVSAWRH
jgi:hypothetical protein